MVLQFIFFLIYLMVFCGNVLYMLSISTDFYPDPTNVPIPVIVMFSGVLVITVFEVSAVHSDGYSVSTVDHLYVTVCVMKYIG